MTVDVNRQGKIERSSARNVTETHNHYALHQYSSTVTHFNRPIPACDSVLDGRVERAVGEADGVGEWSGRMGPLKWRSPRNTMTLQEHTPPTITMLSQVWQIKLLASRDPRSHCARAYGIDCARTEVLVWPPEALREVFLDTTEQAKKQTAMPSPTTSRDEESTCCMQSLLYALARNVQRHLGTPTADDRTGGSRDGNNFSCGSAGRQPAAESNSTKVFSDDITGVDVAVGRQILDH